MVSPGGKQIEPGTTGGDWRQNDWKVKHSKQGTARYVAGMKRGWYEYFKHSWKTTFPDLDSWVRMRLRSILRRRRGQEGRGSRIADSKL